MRRLESIVHGFLLRLPPETAHDLGLLLLRMSPGRRVISDEALRVRTSFGVLNNPVGLAAGFDKTGRHLGSLEGLGFGYIVAGTVTRNPREGNRKPRIVRRREQEALVNAMGFPNPGIAKFLENVRRCRPRSTPLLISVSDEHLESLVECYILAQREAAAIEVNISSPNTPALRHYFEIETFRELASSLSQRKTRPTYLKLPPASSTDQKALIAKMLRAWWDAGFEGVTVVNTLPTEDPGLSTGVGGMSGRPLFGYMLEAVKMAWELTGGSLEINAVGGIFTGRDALTAIMNGATTIQIYTSLVYRGAGAVASILEELLEELRRSGFASITEVRGSSFRK